MFSFIKGLFGSSKNSETIVETAAKGIYNGLDALVFTDEEKAQFRQQQAETVIEFAKVAYDQNSIRSITRRWLAFLTMGPTIFLILLATAVYKFDPEYSKFIFDVVGSLLPWAGGVMIFYFGSGMLMHKKD